MYLEPDAAADNSSFGTFLLTAPFPSLPGDLSMEQSSPVEVTLKELDGIMGQVELQYLASRQTEVRQDGTL